MREITNEIGIAPLLTRYRALGGVLDYVFLEIAQERAAESLDLEAAVRGMAVIDDRLAQWASRHATARLPVEKFFRVRWDESKMSGQRVDLATFWGTDDVEPKVWPGGTQSIPTVDGYKTAFFHPPYGLHGEKAEKAELFAAINRFVLGHDPQRAEIFSWSTDWSNYFEAGHEWWGAYYWTIRPEGAPYMVVVAASSTD